MRLVTNDQNTILAPVDELHTVRLTSEQIKLCLIALDVLNSSASDSSVHKSLAARIKRACWAWCFAFDVKRFTHGKSAFCDDDLGLLCDHLFEVYYNKREAYYDDVSESKSHHSHFDMELLMVMRLRAG